MKSIFILALTLLAFSNHSSAQNKAVDSVVFSKSELFKHLELLSSDAFEGRRTGTKGSVKTQKYIVNKFDSLKVLPLQKAYIQSFSFKLDGKSYNGTNVLGVIKGSEFPEKHIVISAHYDHEGIKQGQIYNGADDNASGTSALLSFAEYFKNNPPKHSVILAAFDAEELGLQGSKYFVNHSIVSLKNIILNINMDMISRSDENELYAAGTRFNMALRRIVLNTKTTINLKLRTGHDGAGREENWVNVSDHASFHKKGIPFLYFGVEDHNDYHQPTDDYENIHPNFYVDAVNTIISVFGKIDGSSF